MFYDVSAWSFLNSFNLEYTHSKINDKLEDFEFTKPKGSVVSKSDYAYVFSWDDYYTPKALFMLLEKGIKVKVATDKFSVKKMNFSYGSILIPVSGQNKSSDEINECIEQISKETGIDFYGLNSSRTDGIDLGSNDFKNINIPKIGLIVGNGVNSYDAGEIWHLLDTRYQIPTTKLDYNTLSKIDLNKYNTLIFVNGSYSNNKTIDKLKSWVENGGNLIGFRNASKWLSKNNFLKIKFIENKPLPKNVKFVDKNKFYGAQLTSGAIFNVELDLSHPINYGYYKKDLSIFRNTNIYIENDEIGFNNPIKYSKENTLISGYISKYNMKSIVNSRPFVNHKLKKGSVNIFTENTNFRAFWYGTNKLMMNAIFFAKIM